MSEHRARFLPVLGAALYLLAAAWRCFAVPPAELWRDWVLLLALVLGFRSFRKDSAHAEVLEPAVMAFLLGIYVMGQLPQVWSILRPAS